MASAKTTLVEVRRGQPRSGDDPRGPRALGIHGQRRARDLRGNHRDRAGRPRGQRARGDQHSWIGFLAAFAGILLTFLAGAEVDPGLFRQRFRESVITGGLSFAVPFAAAGLFAYVVAGWDVRQSEIAGIALSTTSLAVVYAVLVETGLTNTEIGKIIMT